MRNEERLKSAEQGIAGRVGGGARTAMKARVAFLAISVAFGVAVIGAAIITKKYVETHRAGRRSLATRPANWLLTTARDDVRPGTQAGPPSYTALVDGDP